MKKIAPPKKHARLDAKHQFNIEIRDTERRSTPKKKQLFNIKIRGTELRSPPLPPKLSPPKTHARRPEHPHSAPAKRLSPPKTQHPHSAPAKRLSPPKTQHPHSAPAKRLSPPHSAPAKRLSPPKTQHPHSAPAKRRPRQFEITDSLTREQIREQNIEKNEKSYANFIEYIDKRNKGTLPPYEKEEIPAFDQLDIQLRIWEKEYDKEHKTKPTNKIAK
jgi:hypothetical protein